MADTPCSGPPRLLPAADGCATRTPGLLSHFTGPARPHVYVLYRPTTVDPSAELLTYNSGVMSCSGRAAVRFGFAVVFVMTLAAAATAQQPNVAGLVKTLTGSAVITHAGTQVPAAVGRPLAEGDTVKTGPDGRLGITLKDGTRLSLGANTELRIDSFAFSPEQGRLALAVKLLRGVAAYISGRIAELAPGTVKIETPTSVIGVRGTHLLIGVEQP